jgi:hypothetical protein
LAFLGGRQCLCFAQVVVGIDNMGGMYLRCLYICISFTT